LHAASFACCLICMLPHLHAAYLHAANADHANYTNENMSTVDFLTIIISCKSFRGTRHHRTSVHSAGKLFKEQLLVYCSPRFTFFVVRHFFRRLVVKMLCKCRIFCMVLVVGENIALSHSLVETKALTRFSSVSSLLACILTVLPHCNPRLTFPSFSFFPCLYPPISIFILLYLPFFLPLSPRWGLGSANFGCGSAQNSRNLNFMHLKRKNNPIFDTPKSIL